VPLVPGVFDPLPADDPGAIDEIAAVAERVGFPVLIKAAAGGGGRGMRRVDGREDLPAAIVAAAHEARLAFGDGSVYLERLVEGGRHIEVQLLGDSHGAVVALGERDCSTQRRHQKLVEEAPAPGLTEAQRRRLHELAVRIAGTVGLRNAATAEFLYAPDGAFSFLEVNARLQVEHGVTELVTGLDLVREQLLIAAGAPLSDAVLAAAERAATPTSHAIELRVSAEDPSLDFAPVPGTITRWREPGGPGVRMDSGVVEGWRVGGDYDPLLAKLLVHAPDRRAAIARARRAVAEHETGGVQTTLPFHAWLLRLPSFVDGRLRTDLVEREWRPDALRAAAAELAIAAVAAAHANGTLDGAPLQADGSAPGRSGANGVSGWRPASSSAWAVEGRRRATERRP
jgi:acetyl/propionyl-CoA carboxylase alpha subunit